MTHTVNFVADPTRKHLKPPVSTSALAALKHQKALPGEVTIVLTGREQIQELNQEYAGVDAPTDVLSFADGMHNPETGAIYYGDVVIGLPVAETQAAKAGHSLEAELCLLTVHGVLHLLGHKHAEESETVIMGNAQHEILERLGIEAQDLEAG